MPANTDEGSVKIGLELDYSSLSKQFAEANQEVTRATKNITREIAKELNAIKPPEFGTKTYQEYQKLASQINKATISTTASEAITEYIEKLKAYDAELKKVAETEQRQAKLKAIQVDEATLTDAKNSLKEMGNSATAANKIINELRKDAKELGLTGDELSVWVNKQIEGLKPLESEVSKADDSFDTLDNSVKQMSGELAKSTAEILNFKDNMSSVANSTEVAETSINTLDDTVEHLVETNREFIEQKKQVDQLATSFRQFGLTGAEATRMAKNTISEINTSITEGGIKFASSEDKIRAIGDAISQVSDKLRDLLDPIEVVSITAETSAMTLRERISALAEEIEGIQQIKLSPQDMRISAGLDYLWNEAEKADKAWKQFGSTLKGFAKGTVKELATEIWSLGNATDKASKSTKEYGRYAYYLSGRLNGLLGTIRKIRTLLFGVFLVRGAIKTVSNLLQLGSQLTASSAIIKATFSEASDVVEKFTDISLNAFGVSKKAASAYVAELTTMGRQMGVTETSARNMAMNLTVIASDMVTAYQHLGVTLENTQAALEAIYTGETETLKKYGIVLNNVNLQEYAATLGIEKKVTAMNAAEKTLLRYRYVMSRLSGIEGNYQQLQNSYVAQLQRLQQSWQDLGATVGQYLAYVFKPMLSVLNGLIQRLGVIITYLASLFGLQKEVINMNKAVSSVTDTVEEQTDAINDANKAAHKYLASWDDLNVITRNNENINAPESQDVTALLGQVDLLESIQNALKDTLDDSAEGVAEFKRKMVEAFNTVNDALAPMKKALNNFYKKVAKPLAGLVWDNLTNFYNDFLKPVGKWVLGEDGIPKLLNALADKFDKKKWKEFNNALDKLYKALKPFAVAVGKGLIDFLSDFIPKLTNTFISMLTKLANGLAKIFDAIPEEYAYAIGQSLGALLTFVVGVSTVKAISTTVVSGVVKLVSGIGAAFTAAPILTTAVVGAGLVTFLITFTNAVKDAKRAKISENSPFAGILKDVNDFIARADEYVQGVNDLKTAVEEFGSLDVDTSVAEIQAIADKYLELSNRYDELSDGEKMLLEVYADELISKLPEIADLIDDQTKKYKGTYKQLEKIIQKEKERLLLKAYQDLMTEAYKKQAEAEVLLAEKTDKLKEAEEAQKEAEKKYIEELKPYFENMHGLIEDNKEEWEDFKKNAIENSDAFEGRFGDKGPFYEASVALNDAKDTVTALKDELGELDTACADNEKAIESLEKMYNKKSYEIYNTTKTTVTKNTSVFKKGSEDIKRAVENSLKDHGTVTNEAFRLVKAIEKKLKSDEAIQKMKESGEYVVDGFVAGIRKKVGSTDYVAAAETVSNTIDAIVRKNLGIQSPSKEFKEIGEYTVEGFIIGVDDKMKALSKTSTEMSDVIYDDSKNAFDNLSKYVYNIARPRMSNAMGYFISAFSEALSYTENTFVPDFTNAIDKLLNTFESRWSLLPEIVKGPVNKMIEMINSLNSGIINSFNSVGSIASKMSFGGSFTKNIPTMTYYKIPALATGAVLPPNNPFMAVVGDQKHGTNIEAPLNTIVEAFKKVLNEVNTDRPIVIEGDMGKFLRVMKKTSYEERLRLGE